MAAQTWLDRRWGRGGGRGPPGWEEGPSRAEMDEGGVRETTPKEGISAGREDGGARETGRVLEGGRGWGTL